MRTILALAAAALVIAGCSSSTGGHGSTAAASASPAGTPSSRAASPTPTPASPSTPSRVPTTHPAPVPRQGSLSGLQVADLTFVGPDGWALGTAGCLHGSGLCPVLAHSTDNGRSWRAVPSAPGGGATNIRFATDRIGYAYGRAAFFMTTDGGRSWQREPGGADALETLDGNVIRVVDPGNCPPGCTYSIETAPVGATGWHSVTLPGRQGGGVSVQLVRTGRLSALAVYGHTSGGAPSAHTVLFTSRDDGASWVRRGEPCPQQPASASDPHGEVDGSALSSAADGSISVLCTPRGQGGSQFTVTSSDGGAHFQPGSKRALGAATISAFAAASASTLIVSSDDTYRSTDSGRHFSRAAVSPGMLGWAGFASATIGHAISIERRTIWTTTDAGRTWQAATLR